MGWRIGVGRHPSTGRRRRRWSPGGSGIETLEPRALLSATPMLVKDINPAGGGLPGSTDGLFDLTNVDGTLFFGANFDLWKSDGTAAGTVRIVNDASNNTDVLSGVFSLAAFDDLLLFGGSQHGVRRLWRSDGTPAGTFPLVEQQRLPTHFALGDGIAFVNTVNPANGATTQLWRTDGTVAGTFLLKNSAEFVGAELPIAVVGSTVYFETLGTDGRSALWKSDGTVAGTVQVRSGVRPGALTAFDGEVFFTDNQLGLWTSDGTEAGTVPLLGPSQLIRNFGEFSLIPTGK